MKIISEGRQYINEKLHDTMIQHSVFAAIVFLIVSHPATFKLVDNVFKIKNKNILLLVRAAVVGLIMYFGSIYLFVPLQNVLFEGMKSK